MSKPPNNRRKKQSLVIFLEYNLSHFLGSAALAISTISKRFSRPLGDSEPVMHLEDTSTNGTGMASGPDWLPIRKGQARALKSLGKFVVPFNRKPHQEAVPGNLWKSLEIFGNLRNIEVCGRLFGSSFGSSFEDVWEIVPELSRSLDDLTDDWNAPFLGCWFLHLL